MPNVVRGCAAVEPPADTRAHRCVSVLLRGLLDQQPDLVRGHGPLPRLPWSLELAPRLGTRVTAPAVALLLCSLSACSSGPGDVMATSTCPDPLRRVLVASSAPGSDDRVGQATPSPSIDPLEQHPVTAAAVFRPDLHPEQALPVTVTVDDGTGGSITGAETCQVVTVSLQLAAAALSTPYGTVHPGHLRLETAQDSGSLRLVDQRTYIREADDGSGAQDYASLTGGYALLEDPTPGEYRTRRPIQWQPVTPPADDTGAAGAAAALPLAGTLDLVITIG